MIAGAAVHTTTIHAWMTTIAESVKDQRDYLTQLDAAIGDGDHGVNMDRGFDAVGKALAGQDGAVPPGKLLILAGKTLVSTVGGASGPLWGTAFRRAGRALGDSEEFDGQDLLAALRAALDGIVELGAAQPGDKTMVDALGPAVDALASSLDAGEPLETALAAASAAAEEGARATVPLQARKGRASYLGERSIGHQDPGATSAALVMAALERAVSLDGPEAARGDQDDAASEAARGGQDAGPDAPRGHQAADAEAARGDQDAGPDAPRGSPV